MHDLGTLGGYSEAYDINDSAQIVGYCRNVNAHDRAFVYSGTPGNGGAMQPLPTLGGSDDYAYGINNAGQIVGSAATGRGDSARGPLQPQRKHVRSRHRRRYA